MAKKMGKFFPAMRLCAEDQFKGETSCEAEFQDDGFVCQVEEISRQYSIQAGRSVLLTTFSQIY